METTAAQSTGNILDGKKIANEIRAEIKTRVASFVDRTKIQPCLAAVLVGADAASKIYVGKKEKACEQAGMKGQLHLLPASTSTTELLELISQLNQDVSVHGILVQLPLPKQIDSRLILDAIAPQKDVDAFHPTNVGLLSQGRPMFLPCTPHGIMQMLSRYNITVAGKHVVVIGRSDIVGKPMALMMVQRDFDGNPDIANGTVTICHSATPDLAETTKQGDILVAAIGKDRFVTADMVKPGAVVIDVGINRTDDGLYGDVDFENVRNVASWITPVPGGVGPLTVAMLLSNTLKAAEIQSKRFA
jgi:methylenetetrahydrofolate dehydrogenase (NADP+) / methenyltetrahydrofolate cyclohydrolase